MRYLFLLFYSSSLFASAISINVGETKAVFNRFAIPNTSEDRVTLPVDDTLVSYRLTGFFYLESGNQFYFLIAPLATSYTFNSEKNFEFDDENFSADTETEVEYKFNSYRLGYLWKWNLQSLSFWTGIVGKVRDAQIKVSQESISRKFNNIGFVPLAALGFEYNLFHNISLYSHTDALTASQGSAYDSQVELRLNMKNAAISFGKRILGGGADNDKVYNFAQFDTYYAGIIYKF